MSPVPRASFIGTTLEYQPVTDEIARAVERFGSRDELTGVLHDLLVRGEVTPTIWNTLVRAYELGHPDDRVMLRFSTGPNGFDPSHGTVAPAPLPVSLANALSRTEDVAEPAGDHLYLDARSATVLRSPMAPDVRTWYRVVPTFDAAARAFDEGEFPVVMPPDVMQSLPALSGRAGTVLERYRVGQYEGDAAPFRARARELQRALGSLGSRGSSVAPGPVDLTGTAPPAGGVDLAAFGGAPPASGVDLTAAMRPRLAFAAPHLFAQAADGRGSVERSQDDDMLDRAARGIPSVRDGDVAVPPQMGDGFPFRLFPEEPGGYKMLRIPSARLNAPSSPGQRVNAPAEPVSAGSMDGIGTVDLAGAVAGQGLRSARFIPIGDHWSPLLERG